MTDENLTGRTIAGYRLLKRIGEGGTATVYRAEHPERGQTAMKVLKHRMRKDETAVKRFLREAGYGTRVTHPVVVQTFDFGDEDGLYYLALEWATGEPLSDYVQRRGPLPPDEVGRIITQLADGLTAAHAEGIIHRDLKPENIIYDPDAGCVKLLDFGIARDAQLDPAERLTRTGFFVGTLNYVAPEALSGELVDERADLYSVATIAYYLVTGRHPYTGRSPRELFQQLLSQPPAPLNEAVPNLRFTEALERAIMQGLNRDPAKRPASVRAFADDLLNAPEETPSSTGEGTDDDRSRGGFVGAIRSMFGRKPA